jgi:S-adenosyl methyltransferase
VIPVGIPTSDNTHEVAQSLAPGSRIVYVDNDPVVLAHARALLTSSPEGATDYLDADLRGTAAILARAGQTLDFSQPIAVMLIAILHVVGNDEDPYGIVAKLIDAVPSGSYLALSHVPSDIEPEKAAEAGNRLNQLMHQKVTFRTYAEVTRFFDGLDLVEPGVVRVQEWRPDTEATAERRWTMWGGVGRKP